MALIHYIELYSNIKYRNVHTIYLYTFRIIVL